MFVLVLRHNADFASSLKRIKKTSSTCIEILMSVVLGAQISLLFLRKCNILIDQLQKY